MIVQTLQQRVWYRDTFTCHQKRLAEEGVWWRLFRRKAAFLEGVVVLRVFAGTVAMTVRSGDVFRIVVAFRQEGLFRLFGRRGYRVAAPGFDVWMNALRNFHQNQRDATDETEHRGVL